MNKIRFLKVSKWKSKVSFKVLKWDTTLIDSEKFRMKVRSHFQTWSRGVFCLGTTMNDGVGRQEDLTFSSEENGMKTIF